MISPNITQYTNSYNDSSVSLINPKTSSHFLISMSRSNIRDLISLCLCTVYRFKGTEHIDEVSAKGAVCSSRYVSPVNAGERRVQRSVHPRINHTVIAGCTLAASPLDRRSPARERPAESTSGKHRFTVSFSERQIHSAS